MTHNIIVSTVTNKMNCTVHRDLPAMKEINYTFGKFNLCMFCCEQLARQLVIGIIPDFVQTQFEQEKDS